MYGHIQESQRKGKAMKTVSVALLLVAGLAFVLVGCSDNSNPAAYSNGQSVAPSTAPASLAKGDILHQVTGSGRKSLFLGSNYNDLWTISAAQRVGDEFTGEINCHDKDNGFFFHGKIFDIKLDEENTRAKLSWQMTHNTLPPEFQGFTYGFMVVKDMGKGEDDWSTWAIGMDENGIPPYSVQDFIGMTPSGFMDALVVIQAGADPWVYSRGNFTIR
jgi:hypothetical protein